MPATRPKIVVAEPLSQEALRRLSAAGSVVQLAGHDRPSLQPQLADCDALIVRTYARVTAEIIAAAPRLRVIGRAGIGVENIDVAAAAAAGVIVVHTPGASTQAVAELTLGLIIAAERRILWADGRVRQGAFLEARNSLTSRQMSELTLGIIGFGRIGHRLAEIARKAFDMPVIFNDILPIQTDVARPVSKPELYRAADIVSLHVPLTPQTHHLINVGTLQQMRAGAILINTARGAVVDSVAVADALRGGRLASAAFDVLDPEPPPADHPLLAAPNCILTPHIGSRTSSAQARMNDVVDDVIAVLQGREPRHACR